LDIRFLIDLDNGEPHCARHNVTPLEAIEVLRRPGRRLAGDDGSSIAEGQTAAGRYLRVVYRVNEIDGSIFVITAYDMSERVKRAYRKRKHR
jgi:hypothetical protein